MRQVRQPVAGRRKQLQEEAEQHQGHPEQHQGIDLLQVGPITLEQPGEPVKTAPATSKARGVPTRIKRASRTVATVCRVAWLTPGTFPTWGGASSCASMENSALSMPSAINCSQTLLQRAFPFSAEKDCTDGRVMTFRYWAGSARMAWPRGKGCVLV